MLEHIPHWLGAALKGVRAGTDKLAIVQPGLGSFTAIELKSPAFANGGRLPERFTADGEGISPPLFWTGVPAGADSLMLIVEDPDALTPSPTVHAIIWGMPPADGRLAEGAIKADGAGTDAGDVGRNSYRREGWLPPDPPTGHGEHRYAFQLFALAQADSPGDTPSRNSAVGVMQGRVLAAGLLTGTYSRGDPAPHMPGGLPATV